MRARLGTLLFCAAALAACACASNDQASRPSRPAHTIDALGEKVGWYRMPGGDTALITYSAMGGLRLFSLGDTLYWLTLVPAGGNELRWRNLAGSPVFWQREAGSVAGFSWTSPSGEPQTAQRLSGHGYRVEESTVTAGQVRLSGSLFLPPESGSRVPAAVMIHGSGESDRDNAWYMMIVDRLLRSGIAVLLPDKRGSGRSEGDWFTTGLNGFAEDAAAWFEHVANHPAIDSARVGFVGVSQGGHVAPMAARISPAAFLINLSGSAVPLNEQIVHEVEQDMKRDRFPALLDPVVRRVSLWTIRRRRAQWWEVNGPIDPVDSWRVVDVPALVVYGEDDELDNVPVLRSVERLRSLGKDNLQVWVFRGSGHALWEPEESTRIQPDGRRRIRQDLLDGLARWVLDATVQRSGNQATPGA